MSSTPRAYPQVLSGLLAWFRVSKFVVSAAQGDFWDGFDSRQLHEESAGQDHKPWPAFFCVKLSLTIFMLSPTVVPLLKVERRPCSYSTDARMRLDLHA